MFSMSRRSTCPLGYRHPTHPSGTRTCKSSERLVDRLEDTTCGTSSHDKRRHKAHRRAPLRSGDRICPHLLLRVSRNEGSRLHSYFFAAHVPRRGLRDSGSATVSDVSKRARSTCDFMSLMLLHPLSIERITKNGWTSVFSVFSVLQ